MRKLAKAVSYFLSGEYDKIMNAEENGDMESLEDIRGRIA